MNLYEGTIRFAKKPGKKRKESNALFPEPGSGDQKRFFGERFSEINETLGMICGEEEPYRFFFWDASEGEARVIMAVDTDRSDVRSAERFITEYLAANYDISRVSLTDHEEITAERFHQLGYRGDHNGLIRHFRHNEGELRLDYLANNYFRVSESLVASDAMSLEEAKKQAEKLLADQSLYEELERIYSEDNARQYYGNPVHYKISVTNMDSAMQITRLLTHALRVNNRLGGARLNKVFEIRDQCFDEADFENMFEMARGNVVLLDMSGGEGGHGNYADAYEQAVEYMTRIIKAHHIKTLCIFVEEKDHPGFSGSLLSHVAEELDIIELKEGNGNREEAKAYIERLVRENKYEISQEDLEAAVPDKPVFTLSEVYEIYNKWFRNGLRNTIYKSYRYAHYAKVDRDKKKSQPYEELQQLIGLQEVKKVVDEIIDHAGIGKIRSGMGLDTYRPSMHMVFTGNPGSAKTTVARLLTQIFVKEGILAGGKFVECGRADLVGRYVGWTAKTVRAKFGEAQGGILFIDEAYSLVDDSHSFGDEAINTIVQEMENHREDVIVIFAGYPDRMKDFLDKNEGLRSRIAFHLDFPDYNADELLDILKLLAKQKGYLLDGAIEEKCRGIFELAVKQEEFGNGRFARNLLEQAMMAQSGRIMKTCKGKKITRKTLSTLKAEDFDVNLSDRLRRDTKQKIGF